MTTTESASSRLDLAAAPPREIAVDTVHYMPTVIQSNDFERRRAGSSWTQGTLRHVATALNGQPAIIVLDNQTGHSAVGVLVRPETTPSARYGFLIRTAHHPAGTVYRVDDIGAIIPLAERNGTPAPKWEALVHWRNESQAAIACARSRVTDPNAGAWSTVALGDHVQVTREYTLYDVRPEGSNAARQHWNISLAEIANPA